MLSPAQAKCAPCLRVFAESLFVGDEEVRTAMLRLDFDYAGRRVRCGDPRWAGRDRDAELQACRVIEGLGAIELLHLDDCAVTPGVHADYVVAVDGDVHTLCAFTAYAVPQLRALGWHVEIDGAFPWQIVGGDAPLYAAAMPDEKKPDWFALELGVEV